MNPKDRAGRREPYRDEYGRSDENKSGQPDRDVYEGLACGFRYTVRPGETLSSIGMKFGIAWQEIAEANPDLQPPYALSPADEIIVPVYTYVVKRGDTLSRLGERFEMPWQDIAGANDIRAPYVIYPGRRLVIPRLCKVEAPKEEAPSPQYPEPDIPCGLIYVVQSGESLQTVANLFGIDYNRLVLSNPQLSSPYTVHPGQRIKIPMTGYIHKVMKGESLWSIAQQYDVPITVLANLNNARYPYTIYIGQYLVIPVECSKEAGAAGESIKN